MVNVMKVLGIVGSPHKDGRTNKLVTKAIERSEKAGGQTEIIYLIDYDVPQWSEGHKTPRELNEIVDKAEKGSIVLFGCKWFNQGLKEREET
jgi:multimeric flavodoxin WrbA